MLVCLIGAWYIERMKIEAEEPILPNNRPLSRETLMEMPELSREEELLDTPVPFENRVAHLSVFDKTLVVEGTVPELAHRLDVRVSTVMRMVASLGAQVDLIGTDGVCHPSLFAVLQEELSWGSLVDELPDSVTLNSIENTVGVGKSWALTAMNGLGVISEEFDRRGNLLYSKNVVHALRHLKLHESPADDWYDEVTVRSLTRRSDTWVHDKVNTYNLDMEYRIGVSRGRPQRHYSQATLDFLIEISAQHPPAGAWLTVRAAASKLGISRAVATQMLSEFDALAEERVVDSGHVAVCYPPEIIDNLAVEHLSKADDWLTIDGIATLIGKDFSWVLARIEQYADLAQLRKSRSRKLATHYPPHVITKLFEEAIAVPLIRDWVTVHMIGQETGKSVNWIKKRLGEYQGVGEQRVTLSGHVRICYPVSVLDDLKKLAE